MKHKAQYFMRQRAYADGSRISKQKKLPLVTFFFRAGVKVKMQGREPNMDISGIGTEVNTSRHF